MSKREKMLRWVALLTGSALLGMAVDITDLRAFALLILGEGLLIAALPGWDS